MVANFSPVLGRHDKIALQFSGGKDSLACLYLMRGWLNRITVYWLNTGDPFPETLDLMKRIREMCPHFVEVTSDVQAVQDQFGIPSDLVPATRTMLGKIASGDGRLPIQDRFSCCFMTVTKPMHERMMADGITLIIRGQRDDDAFKAPVNSGHIENGIEYLFPISDWTGNDVMAYLTREGAPIPRFYEVMRSMPNCKCCSAWWDESRASYLKRYHYGAYIEYQAKLDTIRSAVEPLVRSYNEEIA